MIVTPRFPRVKCGVAEFFSSNALHGTDRVPHLQYTSDVVEVVESWLYRPVARLFAAVVAAAKRARCEGLVFPSAAAFAG